MVEAGHAGCDLNKGQIRTEAATNRDLRYKVSLSPGPQKTAVGREASDGAKASDNFTPWTREEALVSWHEDDKGQNRIKRKELVLESRPGQKDLLSPP